MIGLDKDLSISPRTGRLRTLAEIEALKRGRSAPTTLGFAGEKVANISGRNDRYVDPAHTRWLQQPAYTEQGVLPLTASGVMSATLEKSRAVDRAREHRRKFYSMLEKRYGARKGNDRSYVEAMERYHEDKAMKELERMSQSTREKQERERIKREKQERERREKEEEESYIRSREREIEQERQWREQMRRQQQQQQQSYARAHAQAQAGPAEEPQLSPRSRLVRRHPSPISKRDALIIMEFDPRSAPTSREIKEKFNELALKLHPDKNLDNPDESSVLFKQLHKAYKLLKKQGGGGGGGATSVRRHNKRSRRIKSAKSRKYKMTKRHSSRGRR
jgi:curved DNA-binding protein CbpA